MIRQTVVSLAAGVVLVAPSELAAQTCVGNGIAGPQAHSGAVAYRNAEDTHIFSAGMALRMMEAVGVEAWYDRTKIRDVDPHTSTLSTELSARVVQAGVSACIVAGMGTSWSPAGGPGPRPRAERFPVGASVGGEWAASEPVRLVYSVGARHWWARSDVGDLRVEDTYWSVRGTLSVAGEGAELGAVLDKRLGEGSARPTIGVVARFWARH